jgi:hypothetical protein
MNTERKVYMTLDRNGQPRKFGNSSKFCWTSARWVNYHLKPLWRETTNRFVESGGMVKIIDLKTDTIETMSAAVFTVRYGNEDVFKAEAKQRIGFSIEPGVLVEMFKAKIFPIELQSRTEEFLKEKQLI